MQYILLFEGCRLKLFRVLSEQIKNCNIFAIDEPGLVKFSEHISQNIITSMRLLVDVTDEEFYTDTIPHVYGKDRKALQRRRLDKYFGGSVHRYIKVQRRHEGGRKDDEILISGINDNDLLQPCLDILSKNNVALTGIHSLPLLVESMLKKWSMAKGKHLLVSQQSLGKIRHSLYFDGQLKMSRLVELLEHEDLDSVEIVDKEILKTIHFLENKRLLATGEIIQCHYLAHRQKCTDLKSWMDKSNNKEQVENIITHTLPNHKEYADVLCVEYLAQQHWPKNHYANQFDLAIHHHNIAFYVLNFLAISLLLATFFIGSYLFYLEHNKAIEISNLKSLIYTYSQRSERIESDFAEIQIDMNDMKYSVEALDQLQLQYNQSPQNFMYALTRSSKYFPNISYREIDWSVKEVSDHSVAPFTATVYGALLGDNSPRKAVQKINELIIKLRQQPGFNSVNALKIPFDLGIENEFKMDGNIHQKNPEEVKFSIFIEGLLL